MSQPPPLSAPPPVMIAVFNQKGGVAKTTTSVNLAVCLVAFGYRVLLVDLDAQGNATGALGVAPLPPSGAFEVITGRARVEDVALDTAYEGLWLLPATTSLRDSDHLLNHAGRRRGLLETRLAGTGVDVIIVDCPPALAAATATALASATAVLMPVRPDPFAHEGLVNTWYEIKRIRDGVNPHLGVAGVLMTMTASEPAGEDVGRVIRAEFGNQVYPMEIATDPKVAEAAQLNLPIAVLDPDGLAGRAYVDAAAELLGRLERQNRPETRLPPAQSMTEALNRLREWRSLTHSALLRVPDAAEAWTANPDPPPEAPAPARRRKISLGWVWPLLAGLAAGMALEAFTGLLGRVLALVRA